MKEIKEKEYKRQNFKDYDSNIDILSASSDVYDIAIESMERHKTRPPVYSNDSEGLKLFIDNTLEYLKEIRERNAEAENSKRMRLIPSIEMWATYLGITRQTIHTYETTYNSDFKDFIQRFKNVIAMVKKELAENGKIPPVIHIFDFVNNHNYLNTNNVTVNQMNPIKENAYELPNERIKKLHIDETPDILETVEAADILDEPLPYR